MILIFDSETDANEALETINTRYGCDYMAENGYRMEVWDTVKKAFNTDKWYFNKPVARLGKTVDELMEGIGGFEEVEIVEIPTAPSSQ